jgi:hypothetical protein
MSHLYLKVQIRLFFVTQYNNDRILQYNTVYYSKCFRFIFRLHLIGCGLSALVGAGGSNSIRQFPNFDDYDGAWDDK